MTLLCTTYLKRIDEVCISACLCEQVDDIIRGRARKSSGIYLRLVIFRIAKISCCVFFCPFWGSSKAACSMKEGNLRAMARQMGVAPSLTRAQSHQSKQEDKTGPVMITKILGSAKDPVITHQVCRNKAGLRLSQQVKSGIEDWGGMR